MKIFIYNKQCMWFKIKRTEYAYMRSYFTWQSANSIKHEPAVKFL